MITITKERLLTIKQWRETYGPGSNVVLPAEEAEELARIALASLEAEAVMFSISGQNVDSEEHVSTSKAVVDAWVEEWNQVDGSPGEPLYKTMPLYYHAALPAPVVPEEATPENVEMLSGYVSTYKLTDSERDIAAEIWNACRAAMLQSGNFRENKNSSTNNFREIAETSTNYPVIPSEVLSAIQKVAKIRADFDDFDGDRRGIGDCLDEAEQELIVTINKYASQLAAEPIAPNDVREQTAIPQVPVTPDGWISCSERMPNTKTAVLVAVEFDRKGDWRMKWATYIPGHPDANDGWIIPGASWKPSHWMPLPEPPQEAK
ncbi:putative prophage protein [Escherichia coli]|nr:DUF551 domain-containing protein [Salmonella enterica subsp. enterica serovar Heidelberg]EFL6491633.1 DUF551 domain-containing protein [Escherichia coli]EHC0921972.1 DUF551 domain-containing protein [Salmonella enterica subsp. enterica serovar Derby]EBE3959694.1 DUF551 domain-containing protein [Salmonella enterica subsp. enterica serovar Heidelberg]EBF2512542.1 DUF551 domain-containing protein [Salmonella enterica subsp. enterica serovar Heidelberg]